MSQREIPLAAGLWGIWVEHLLRVEPLHLPGHSRPDSVRLTAWALRRYTAGMSDTSEYPFVLADDDRFARILVSSPIHFQRHPKQSAVISFFVIQRAATRLVDVVNVHKTFKEHDLVSRSVQEKKGIRQDNIDDELAAIMGSFSEGIRQGSGIDVQWNSLDLSGLDSRKEQLATINAWPHMAAWKDGER